MKSGKKENGKMDYELFIHDEGALLPIKPIEYKGSTKYNRNLSLHDRRGFWWEAYSGNHKDNYYSGSWEHPRITLKNVDGFEIEVKLEMAYAPDSSAKSGKISNCLATIKDPWALSAHTSSNDGEDMARRDLTGMLIDIAIEKHENGIE